MPGTRKLGRATDSRNAMLRAMVTYLFENGKIETTVTRAKEVRAMAEKMVTRGKSGCQIMTARTAANDYGIKLLHRPVSLYMWSWDAGLPRCHRNGGRVCRAGRP